MQQRQTLSAISAATLRIAELEWDLDIAILEQDGKWLVASNGTRILASHYERGGYSTAGYEVPIHRQKYIEWRTKDLTNERAMIRKYCYG